MLDARQRGQEVDHQHDHDQAVGHGGEHLEADAEGAAEHLLAEVAVLDVVAHLGDDVVLVVELLHLLVGLQVVEPPGRVAGDLGDLLADHRSDRDHEEREHADHHDEHEQDREPAPQTAAHEELDDRVEPDRQEHRHHQQDQDRGDAQQLLGQEDRDEGAERTEEADVEGRVPQQCRGRDGRLDRDVRRRRGLVDHEVGGVVDLLGDVRGGLRRLLRGVGRRLGPVGIVADLLDDLLDHVRQGFGVGRPVRRPWVGHRLPEPGAPAQDSSSPKPATTSRRAPSWAVMASRRLDTRSTSAWMLASSRSASATRVVSDRVGLGPRRRNDLLGLAARAGEQALGLGLRLLAVGVGLGRGLACPLLRGGGAILGLLDQALGLGRGVGVVLGGLAGEPLLLHGQRAPRLLHLAVRGGTSLLGLPHRRHPHLVGLLLGGQAELVGLPAGGSEEVLGLGLGQAALRLGVGGEPRAHLVELLELHHPHVVGLAGGVGADAARVALGLGADLGGVTTTGVAHVAGLVLGELEHRRRAATEAGVRRVGVLLELAPQSLEVGLELDDALLAAREAGGQAGLLRLELAHALVDGRLVVATAAHDRQGCGRGRRRGDGAGRRGCCGAAGRPGSGGWPRARPWVPEPRAGGPPPWEPPASGPPPWEPRPWAPRPWAPRPWGPRPSGPAAFGAAAFGASASGCGSSFGVTGSTCVSSPASSADSGSSKMDRPWSRLMLRHPLSARTDCVEAQCVRCPETNTPRLAD